MESRILKISIIIIIFILGCASDKAVKPPSVESLKVKDAIEVLSTLKKAYENRDAGAFMRQISPSSSNFNFLEERIKKDFSIFGKISLNMTPRWARVKEDLLQLSVHWEGKWYDSSGKEIRDRGNGIFSFKDEKEMKLIKIDGDSPFGITGD